ncbi:uncharacterized protein RHIMIDRAFT_253257, partial [Rhizopus microsporus ATCC 52813]
VSHILFVFVITLITLQRFQYVISIWKYSISMDVKVDTTKIFLTTTNLHFVQY